MQPTSVIPALNVKKNVLETDEAKTLTQYVMASVTTAKFLKKWLITVLRLGETILPRTMKMVSICIYYDIGVT